MARERLKWKCVFFLLLLNTVIKSLPIAQQQKLPNLVTVDTTFLKLELPELHKVEDAAKNNKESNTHRDIIFQNEINDTKTVENVKIPLVLEEVNSELIHTRDASRNQQKNNIRPGQAVVQYNVELSFDGGSFTGRVVMPVTLTPSDNKELVFYMENLDVESVMVGVFTEANAVNVGFSTNDGRLEFTPNLEASSYVIIVQYSGEMSGLRGLFQGGFLGSEYIVMNLHPTHARRVFPCMDEPTLPSTVTFTFNNSPFPNLVSNTMLQEGSTNQLLPLQGPLHLWGMVTHNFPDVMLPVTNVQLRGRLGAQQQDGLASVAINSYFNALQEWTEKPYFEIVLNQQQSLNIFALPDYSTDWYALSTICIWEPDILMRTTNSVKQRKNAIVKIAEAMARQWFGYVIYPDNWRNQWVTSGLATYSAYEVAKNFQGNPLGEDLSLLDMNTIFVTDVIQESMYYDAYSSSRPLEPEGEIFNEPSIRETLNGILKYKAPAILRMLRLILGREDDDYIQMAARGLLSMRALQTVSSTHFYDAINGNWFFTENKLINDVIEFLNPWVHNRGYPMITVGLRQGGVYVNQEYFSYSNTAPAVDFMIPLTFTTSINPNYEMENVYNIQMMNANANIDIELNGDEGDYVLFNIQGQGYYRVNYDDKLWERIIDALGNPDTRAEIHPLNRAKLVDDVLNLARAGKIDYNVAFSVALTMEHETEYAVWKAFVRNMDFIRKRLEAYVTDNDDLDPDIYLRMVRRTVTGVEQKLGFKPDTLVTEPAMTTLTRALVMDHACRANYEPCIAASLDLFYESGADEPTVNPNIPLELRPVVYCTMVRQGDEEVRTALNKQLEIEEVMYDRLVILESLACSRDEGFIDKLLMDTIVDSPYTLEERVRIYKAIAESGYQNARIAANFLKERTPELRNSYGGPEKLEEIIKIIADNSAGDVGGTFQSWVTSTQSNLDDSTAIAERLDGQVKEDGQWDTLHRNTVYEWIDENDAPTLAASLLLLSVTLFVTLFN